jgi:hypothetical protein
VKAIVDRVVEVGGHPQVDEQHRQDQDEDKRRGEGRGQLCSYREPVGDQGSLRSR